MAMPVPTAPHSSIVACMTLSRASHAIGTVVTHGPAALRSPWSPCHCWTSGFIAFVWSMLWIMRSIASSVPWLPTTPTGAPACVSAVAAGSSDTLPWAPQGNIIHCGCPHLLQFAGRGPFRPKVQPSIMVRIVWSPACEIWACTWGWCRVPVTAACDSGQGQINRCDTETPHNVIAWMPPLARGRADNTPFYPLTLGQPSVLGWSRRARQWCSLRAFLRLVPACHKGRGQGPSRSASPAGRGGACT